MSVQAEEWRKEKNEQDKPGLEEAGEKKRRKKIDGGIERHFGPGASGPVEDKNKDGGASGGGVDEDLQEEEAVAGATGCQRSTKSVNGELPYDPKFSQWQLEQLETIFQRSHSGYTPAR